jgi:hypothetical protein
VVVGALAVGCADMARQLQDLTQLQAQVQSDVGSPVQVNLQSARGSSSLLLLISSAAVYKLSDAGVFDYETRVAMSAYQHYPRRWPVANISVAVVDVQQKGPFTYTHRGTTHSWSVAALDAEATHIHQLVGAQDPQADRVNQMLVDTNPEATRVHRMISGNDSGSHLPSGLFSQPSRSGTSPTRP